MHRQRGTSMVEFAFMTSLLMMATFGVIEFGRALYAYHAVANAARLGSRWAAVRGSDGVACQTYSSSTQSWSNSTCPESASDIQSYVQTQLPLLDASDISIPTPYWQTTSGGTCTAGTPGCEVVVEVDYTFNSDVPFIQLNPVFKSVSTMVVSQ